MLIGIVGKPSVGKSTFFKSSTLAEAEIALYPFTTIKPNQGVGYVKVDCVDKEFDLKCNPAHGFCLKGNRFIPVKLLDVAGLVPGASKGKGLGNQFLDDLREADAFIHIVDVSGTTDQEGKQTENYDVLEDIKFLEDELNEWYYSIFSRVWKTFSRKTEMEEIKFSDAVLKQFSGLKVDEEHIKNVFRKLSHLNSEKPSLWSYENLKEFASELRKQSKPMIIAANKIDTENGKENYEKIKTSFSEQIIIPVSSESELALREAAKNNLIEYVPGEREFKIIGNLTENQKKALEKIKKSVLDIFDKGTGVQEVLNRIVLNILNQIAVYPVENGNKFSDRKGNILPDCFLFRKGATALDLAYHLHTDFGKNFVKAVDSKTKRILSKNYKLEHGDIIEIISK